LDYLVLTNGGAFAVDTRVFTVIGAILLALGLLEMATLVLTVCLCCICIRRALRRNNGQGLSYAQNAAYTIAQMCAHGFGLLVAMPFWEQHVACEHANEGHVA
jgi:Tfp pilus assembly protein PilZ